MLNTEDEIYSVRKIPLKSDENELKENSQETDKIKIIELCNAIDIWEKEVLFSDNGFFSYGGKEVENKSKEFISELNRFVNSQIDKMNFVKASSKDIALDIKDKKIKAITKQMQEYSAKQLSDWELQVYEDSLKNIIQRAVLYKTNPEIISSSYKNALAVLDFIASKEKWNSKTKSARKRQFESEFYSEIIDAFINDKDVNAFIIFNQFKDKLNIEDKEEMADILLKLKNNIVAYNWAQELISYNLSKKENEQEIKSVTDKDVKAIIEEYMSAYEKEKEKKKTQENDLKNENNWKEIISVLNDEPDRAFLYIDISLSEESQRAKKSYINSFRQDGYIKTKFKKFIELIKDFFENIENFKSKSISDYRAVLSKEDFEIIEGLKDISPDDYCFFISDYDYVRNNLDEEMFSSEENLYNLIKILFVLRRNYINANKKEPDIDVRNRLISSALERFKVKKTNKEHK